MTCRLMEIDAEGGRQAYLAWSRSKHYAMFPRDLAAEDIMKLFLPAVPQDTIQLQRPLPPNYREWLEGFRAAEAEDNQRRSKAEDDGPNYGDGSGGYGAGRS